MNVKFIGTGFPDSFDYGPEERSCWQSILQQIHHQFPNQQNLLVSLTWFGPQFDNNGWSDLLELNSQGITFDNLFLVATVDPPYVNVTEIQEIKNLTQALCTYYLGNFDSPHQFNFFAPIITEKFKQYSDQELLLTDLQYLFVNYNRKPKQHRVEFVKQLIAQGLDKLGTVTLGTDSTNDLLLTLGEKDKDYQKHGNSQVHWGQYGLPHDMYSLHRMDIWSKTFLYINAATEFNPINDLFCQQDTFKPMLGLRPFVINGVQRTYRWLRLNGFKTFNHYWSHIPIETGDVHTTLIQLVQHLKSLSKDEIYNMYHDMMPDLQYNKLRFFEFSNEQKYKMNHLFD